MALRQVIISRDMQVARDEMSKIDEKLQELAQKREALAPQLEEAEAELDTLDETTSEEDRKAMEDVARELVDSETALDEEENELNQQRGDLQKQLDDLQKQLDEINARAARKAQAPEAKREARKVEKTMDHRKFFGMNVQERDAFFAREDVASFVERAREMGKQRRSVTGADLLIPDVVLGLIRENLPGYSKLYKHVNVRRVPGDGKMLIAGAIPEAVWTEMCAKINEASISFSMVQVTGYKVAAGIYICNALLEDSSIALGAEIIMNLTQSLGLALDKAILYGTGTNMPLGIVPRLVQTAAPGSLPAGTRAWVDLHTSNVISIAGSKTDLALFKSIVTAASASKGKYSTGPRFWAMNENTKAKLVVNAMGVNAAGAIVTGQNGTMPIVGGVIEELSFIPDNVIIGGYGGMYLLAERAGTAVDMSEEYRFMEDQTTFRAKARYDGIPVIPEAFVAMDIAGGTISGTAVTFAPDTANATTENEGVA